MNVRSRIAIASACLFLLTPVVNGAVPPQVEMDAARGELVIRHRGQPLLVYAFASNQFKPYVRALYAANGLNILRDAPADHLHHHGLMYAVRANGINFWEETGEPGHERGVKIPTYECGLSADGAPEARFTHLIHWLAHTNAGTADSATAALLIEKRTIVVTVNGDEVAVDWTGEFRTGTKSVKLHGSAYNGLGLRLPKEFDHVAARQNSVAAPYSTAATWDVTAAKWSSVSGTAEGKQAAAALFAAPANLGTAQFFSMLNPFTYLAVTQNLEKEPIEYKAGDRFSVRYLLTIYPESKPAEFLNQRQERWIRQSHHPPKNYQIYP